jgi:hypothetical protein
MASTVKIIFDLTQGQWSDLHDETLPPLEDGTMALRDDVEWMGVLTTELSIGRWPGGIREPGGSPAVIIRANRQDGSVVLIETSLGVFTQAAQMMMSLDEADKKTNDAIKKAGDGI